MLQEELRVANMLPYSPSKALHGVMQAVQTCRH
jgi:hypothetical protein